MANQIKHLLNKHEEWSLDPQHPYKTQPWYPTYSPRTWDLETRNPRSKLASQTR